MPHTGTQATLVDMGDRFSLGHPRVASSCGLRRLVANGGWQQHASLTRNPAVAGDPEASLDALTQRGVAGPPVAG